MSLSRIILPYPNSSFQYLRVEDVDNVLSLLLSEGVIHSVYKYNNGFIVFTNNTELFLKEFTKGLRVICNHFCSFAPRGDCEMFKGEVNTYIGKIERILGKRVKLERAKQKVISILKELKKTIEKSNGGTLYGNRTGIKRNP